MIPADWLPHHRDDGELIGYLAPHDDGLCQPMTLLGTAVGSPADEESAAAHLDELGLAYLAEPWFLQGEDGRRQRVVIVEVNRDRAVVTEAAFAQVVGRPADVGTYIAVELPADRLSRP